MGIYHGGNAVSRGVYWNPVDGHNVSIKKHGILPGDENRKYLRVSSGWLLIIAPLTAMSFILFLSLFGVGILLALAVIPVIKLSFVVIASAVRVCSGLPTRRVVHKWSFSGKLHRRNARISDKTQKMQNGSGNGDTNLE